MRPILGVIVVLALGLAGCSAADPVSCGDLTCGGDEYCYVECTCCGIIPSDAGPPPTPSADYSCRPLPDGCSADDLCSCDVARFTSCTAEERKISIPCA